MALRGIQEYIAREVNNIARVEPVSRTVTCEKKIVSELNTRLENLRRTTACSHAC